MRRSTSVQLVLLPMLATAAVASAQPGPQDPQPPPPQQPQQQGDPNDPNAQLTPPGMTEPQLSPPGMTPEMDPQGQPEGDGVICNVPETWPEDNQQLGVPPYECQAVRPRCDDPYTWSERDREIGIPPAGCVREYGVFEIQGGWGFRGHVIRGGFGHYFGTGGG